MEILHALVSVLAAFRIVDLFVGDTLWRVPRKWLPNIPWSCVRCMSVWAGAICTAFLLTIPWLNWPLAISWLYLAYGDWAVARATTR